MMQKIKKTATLGVVFLLFLIPMIFGVFDQSNYFFRGGSTGSFVPYIGATATVDLNGEALQNISYFNYTNQSQMTITDTTLASVIKAPLIRFYSNFAGTRLGVLSESLVIMDEGTDASGAILYFTDGPAFSNNAVLEWNGVTKVLSQSLPSTGTMQITNGGGMFNPRGYVVTGLNTAGNMTQGDINASIVYVDQLTYKSPEWVCDQDSHWCKITSIQHQVSIYLQFDNFNDLNIQSVYFNDQSYTPQQFNQQICNASQRNRNACDKILNKINKRQCENDGFSHWDGSNCRINPTLLCDSQNTTIWSYASDSCEYSAQKDCESSGNAWNQFTESCTVVNNTPTAAELQFLCTQNRATIWYQGSCMTLEEYYA